MRPPRMERHGCIGWFGHFPKGNAASSWIARPIASLLMSGACLLLLGCRTVNSELALLFGDTPNASSLAANSPLATAEAAATGGKFAVELRADGRKPELIQLPLGDSLYVQQALEQSGAIKRFRRMKIELYRQLPSGGGHRLDVPFDRASRQVPPGSDYALHQNDRIVITEDSSTIVDDMLHSITGS